MRTVLIAPEFIPNWGGVGTYCIELARSLSARSDIELHVVAPLRCIDGSNTKYTESQILDYFHHRVHLHMLGKANETYLYNMGFQYRTWKHLPDILKEYQIELIHSQHAHMPDIMLKWAGISHRVPTVTTVHSTVRNQYEGIRGTSQAWSEMDSSEKYELVMYPFLRVAEEFYLRKCDERIFVSRWTRDYVRANYSAECTTGRVIHNGVDTERFRPKESSDEPILKDIADPIILYASRLTVARGAHLMARAIPLVLKENREVHFVFAGAGNTKALLGTLKMAGVPRNKYTVLGYIDYEDLPALYRRAYGYVMPTSWENLPFKLLEAMSSAVPVVTTNVGGIPEVIQHGHNGLFAPRDQRGVAERIVELLGDRELARRLGRNARNTVLENFSWSDTARKTVDVYESLLYQDQ